MSSRKRVADASGATPAQKHQRGATPATAVLRPQGRVVLNVGGEHFESSRSTLEGSSSYFRALLSRWDEDADAPLFIDCDADAFRVLLSHMRIASHASLPKDDEDLFARVLLLAEYLGMDGLLAKVKAKAYSNLHPDDDCADPVAAFDASVGTLLDAIDSKVLPARFFAPAPKPPEPPPERVVKSLIPAPAGYVALFMDEPFRGRVGDDADESIGSELRDVLSFAVVELRDGTSRVEAVVQRSMDSTRINALDSDAAHPTLQNHLEFASEVRCVADGEPWKHHLILPPAGAMNMLPVAPGTIRGVWAKPAITGADVDKVLTVAASGAIIVDGEVRSATWGDRPIPSHIKGKKIHQFTDSYGSDPRSQFRINGGGWQQVPYMIGAANQVIKDIAFVEMDRGADVDVRGGGTVPTKLYIADTLGPVTDVYHSNRLVDVTRVKMPNGLEFSHTSSAN